MSKPKPSPIEKAIDHLGGPARAAEALGESAATIGMWKLRNRCPADKVLTVEAATGISRHELRPDIFGWGEEARA